MDNRHIHFTINLTEDDWDANFRGWRCEVLALPTIELRAAYLEKKDVNLRYLKLEGSKRRVLWMRSDPKDRSLRLEFEVSADLVPSRWKLVTEILAVITAILTLLAAALGLRTCTGSEAPKAQSRPSAVDAATVTGTSTTTTAPSPPTIVSSSASATVAPASSVAQCPTAPRPEKAQAKPPHILWIAQSSTQSDALKASVESTAREARAQLGVEWDALNIVAEKRLVQIDGAMRFVYAVGWYGLSQRTSLNICCFLRERGWTGDRSGVQRICEVKPQLPRP